VSRTRAQEPAVEQPTPPRPPVALKGGADGLRVSVTAADAGAEAVEESLRAQLARRGAFFRGAPVVLELPAGRLDLALAARLAPVIEAAGMAVGAVVARDTRPPRPAEPGREPAAGMPAGAALWVTGPLRSGQRIAHDGSVVVVGDVNPGAEVLAGGSVVVWGRLRGTVEAGLAAGAEDALVCALDLAPTQLRIGDALARAPEEPNRDPEPEVARRVDGRIVVDAWR
jgi:septum site-determining protein MinC